MAGEWVDKSEEARGETRFGEGRGDDTGEGIEEAREEDGGDTAGEKARGERKEEEAREDRPPPAPAKNEEEGTRNIEDVEDDDDDEEEAPGPDRTAINFVIVAGSSILWVLRIIWEPFNKGILFAHIQTKKEANKKTIQARMETNKPANQQTWFAM